MFVGLAGAFGVGPCLLQSFIDADTTNLGVFADNNNNINVAHYDEDDSSKMLFIMLHQFRVLNFTLQTDSKFI